MPEPSYDLAFAPDADVIAIGKLELPSGRVVACDPYFCAKASPFSRAAPPGRYEVQIRRVTSPEWGTRVALARLVFRPGAAAASYEPAAGGLDDSGIFFVDSGVASFMDEVTRAAFAELLVEFYRTHPEGNYYADVLRAEFEKNVDPDDPTDHLGLWTMHRLPGAKLNVAIFSSGMGDGSYQSWWGFGEDGEPVSLVTDFGLL